MPRSVRRKHKGEKGKAWKITDPGGKVVAQSSTKRKANIAASIANRARKKR